IFHFHISMHIVLLMFIPLSVTASITKLKGILSKFSIVIRVPFAGSYPSYSTFFIAMSAAQFSRNQPFQNHERFSPVSFSIVRKKSSGVGCLYAQCLM